MDWVKIVYSFILLVCGLLIFVTSSSRKGDERKKFISTKAQSYAFVVVIGMLILEVIESIYRTFQGKNSYDGIGISPLIFLTMISVVYLITFLTYRKKYGD
ncbi:hypothetical protein H8R29_18075 [Priestia megaterium]|jgi:hypothetical protein|uniref:Putative membrane protein n=1 Tax=Priestia megaterium (strain ATCC 14581 / DSM 32 / CCUG 1817 / JCM 2506 / NBRC 15308 / NCIMB 9376 / NCTC 10342 / NRRL B-14308 / VKM B-512 / Ford 19) TaxID=1348623 RepID=A0A0B6ALI0_PRIM2|nr:MULTISPECIES: hypothetical protein [Priestia]AJI24366.1 putative membrane protein [Priestia megaterium NBRC 15308 = ATCC 14581]KFN05157.1 putative membrane protein [Priestia megaterium]KGJ77218.1 hypothetical protein BMT_25925 [Priestia megaterium NBRC 15308 = ATCC 14581]MBU8754567.1 hypothetical protein [Priestia megaterium]MBY0198078.1 hypothetical protein [Priestia megaterium]